MGEALPITSTQSRQLWDALCGVYDRLGFAAVTGGDEVFRSLMLARLVEPVSKLDTIRVLTELGIQPAGVSHDLRPATRVRQGRLAATAGRGVC